VQFDELKKELKNIVFITVREDSDDYFEVVISKGEVAHLSLILGKFFGARVWPSEHKLSEEIENFIAEFGGIMPNQTLYFRKEDNETVFAMLWPWSDGNCITVKIGKR
jgi:hypothetical protein